MDRPEPLGLTALRTGAPAPGEAPAHGWDIRVGVVSLDRRRPVIHAYRTLLGLPQLYFHTANDLVYLITEDPAVEASQVRRGTGRSW